MSAVNRLMCLLALSKTTDNVNIHVNIFLYWQMKCEAKRAWGWEERHGAEKGHDAEKGGWGSYFKRG